MPSSKRNRDQRALSKPDGALDVDEIWELYGIGKSTFYERLHVLKIKPVKLEGWAYLTKEQLADFHELDKHLKVDRRYKTFRKIPERQDAPKEVVNSDAAPKVSVNEVEKAPSTSQKPTSPHAPQPLQKQVPPLAPKSVQRQPAPKPLPQHPYRKVQRKAKLAPTTEPDSPESLWWASLFRMVAMGFIILGLLQSYQRNDSRKPIQSWSSPVNESVSESAP